MLVFCYDSSVMEDDIARDIRLSEIPKSGKQKAGQGSTWYALGSWW